MKSGKRVLGKQPWWGTSRKEGSMATAIYSFLNSNDTVCVQALHFPSGYFFSMQCHLSSWKSSPFHVPQNRERFQVVSLWSQKQQDRAWLQRGGLDTWRPEKKCADMGRAGAALPKLGALCKVMSRITLVPKQDHIKRNCWATFFSDPCLLAATYKRAKGFKSGWLDLHCYCLL